MTRPDQELLDAAAGLRQMTWDLLRRGMPDEAASTDQANAALLWAATERGDASTVFPLGEIMPLFDRARELGVKIRRGEVQPDELADVLALSKPVSRGAPDHQYIPGNGYAPVCRVCGLSSQDHA